jgi:hypothetical protein
MDNDTNKIKLMEMYLQTLNEKELKAYAIAKSFLGTSFQLEKSVGFLRWLRETKVSPTTPSL